MTLLFLGLIRCLCWCALGTHVVFPFSTPVPFTVFPRPTSKHAFDTCTRLVHQTMRSFYCGWQPKFLLLKIHLCCCFLSFLSFLSLFSSWLMGVERIHKYHSAHSPVYFLFSNRSVKCTFIFYGDIRVFLECYRRRQEPFERRSERAGLAEGLLPERGGGIEGGRWRRRQLRRGTRAAWPGAEGYWCQKVGGIQLTLSSTKNENVSEKCKRGFSSHPFLSEKLLSEK